MQGIFGNNQAIGAALLLNWGIGVTAYSEADARAIIEGAFPQLEVASMRMVNDLSTLEQNHEGAASREIGTG